MTIPGSRFNGTADVLIDYERCTACGACVEVCSGYPLHIENDTLRVDQTRGFGCIACGACVAVCPRDAIRITGRDLFPADVVRVPRGPQRADFDQLNALLLSRRSTRSFKPQEVDDEIIQKILDASTTAPMGIPPAEVGVCVFRTHQAVQELRKVLTTEMTKWRWMFSPLSIALMRPFIGKENASAYQDFIAPAIKLYTSPEPGGRDWFFYDAPLAMYFYGTIFNDPADPVIAATYAMLAGEALGLGSCMLGFPGYAFQYSSQARRKYHLPQKIQPGLMVIFGYPAYQNRNAIRRRFREVSMFS